MPAARTVYNGPLATFDLAKDTVSALDYQYVKLVYGADGVATVVEAANPLPVNSELTTLDMDTGAGTADRAVVGLLVPGAGGPSLVPGDATLGMKTQISQAPNAVRTSDGVGATTAIDKLMWDNTALDPQHAVIDTATSGDNTLVAAPGPNNIIIVHQMLLVCSADVTVRFESGASGTAKSGQMQCKAGLGFVLPFSPIGWFKTAVNELLNLELSAAVSVDGTLGYTVATP